MMVNKIPYKSDHRTQRKFDKNVISLMIPNGIPFNIASSPNFKKMVGDLDPSQGEGEDEGYLFRIYQEDGDCDEEQCKRNGCFDLRSLG